MTGSPGEAELERLRGHAGLVAELDQDVGDPGRARGLGPPYGDIDDPLGDPELVHQGAPSRDPASAARTASTAGPTAAATGRQALVELVDSSCADADHGDLVGQVRAERPAGGHRHVERRVVGRVEVASQPIGDRVERADETVPTRRSPHHGVGDDHPVVADEPLHEREPSDRQAIELDRADRRPRRRVGGQSLLEGVDDPRADSIVAQDRVAETDDERGPSPARGSLGSSQG